MIKLRSLLHVEFEYDSSPGDYSVDSTIGPYCLVQPSSAQQWQFSWNAKKEEERWPSTF